MSASPDRPSFAASSGTAAAPVRVSRPWRLRERAAAAALRIGRPELWALLGLTGVLNLWSLSRNGWANVYYSAAVRSMSSSWHDFLYASFDRSGVMTVDKPPLALWVQSLSVRVFGYHPLSLLVPQALMGMATVVLVYDLVRRRFGRLGGFIAGLALALTPMTVAISRHNNPDALLVLACVAAVWCAVRGLEGGRTRWLVLSGVCVGLGFETKMGVALAVVPGIAAAWMWVAPAARGRLHALRQLLAGAGAMVLVGGAWPALVELTPASSRPWIAGTSDNRVVSLIFEYNGLGRVDGQAGGPARGLGGGQNNMFGGSSGPLRLLNSALGGQVGWLLGFALVSTVAMVAVSRLRRRDPRAGWLIAVGGAFLVSAVLFSFASGIFHPYYVSLLAPFLAALVGAGAGELFGRRLSLRVVAPLAIAAGVIVELVIRGHYPAQLHWLVPVLICLGVVTIAVLVLGRSAAARTTALAVAIAALLLAPAVWAFDTLSYATSSTFPAGGPASAETEGQGFGAGARGRSLRAFGAGGPAAPALFGSSPSGAPPAGVGPGGPPPGAGASGAAGGGRGTGAFGPPGGAGAGFGGNPFAGNTSSLEHRTCLHRHPRGRDARRLEPVRRGQLDHRPRRRRRGDRGLLGPGERGQPLVARRTGPQRQDPLGARRRKRSGSGHGRVRHVVRRARRTRRRGRLPQGLLIPAAGHRSDGTARRGNPSRREKGNGRGRESVQPGRAIRLRLDGHGQPVRLQRRRSGDRRLSATAVPHDGFFVHRLTPGPHGGAPRRRSGASVQ